MPAARARLRLTASSPGYATVLAGGHDPAAPDVECLIVVAETIPVGGRLVDGEGRGLADHTVYWVPDREGWRAALPPLALDTSSPVGRRLTTTDGAGRFQFEAVPRIAGFLEAGGPGWEQARVSCPDVPLDDVELVLRPVRPPAGAITGIVLDEYGEPAAGARVALGLHGARTEADGRFAIESEGVPAGATLWATRSGSLPARLEDPAGPGAAEPGWPEHVVLTLGGAPLSISGTVLDAAGDPVAGASVWFDDPTFFGTVEGRLRHVETLVLGENLPPEATTDEHGRFTLGGLLPRAYDLVAGRVEDLSLTRLDDVGAGRAGVVLRFPAPDPGTRVAGRCLSRAGEPVEGVEVSGRRVMRRIPWPGTGVESTWAYESDAVRTGPDGRFELSGLPEELDGLAYSGPPTIAGSWDFPEGADRENLELVVPLRLHLQVEVGPAFASATSFQLRDGAGSTINLLLIHDRGSSSTGQGMLTEERSPVYAVTDAARELVLYEGRDELCTVALELETAGVNVIRVD